MLQYNNKNEYVKKRYERSLLRGKHRDEKTVREVWRNICILEKFTNWEDFIYLNVDKAEAFNHWLNKQKNRDGKLLSLSTVGSILRVVREFINWLIKQKKFRVKLAGDIADYLYLSDNDRNVARSTREKTPPTIKELEKTLEAMPYETDIQKRDRAIFAFMILTCVRDKALVTLKIMDFNLTTKIVWQNPKHVHTKRKKSITTRLISKISKLAEGIFLEWYDYLTNELGFAANDPLFPKPIDGQNFRLIDSTETELSKNHWATTEPIRRIFKRAFERVDLPYFNPHLFRNTIANWAVENCNQLELKAISMNMGHEHIATLLNSYAKLTKDKQVKTIEGIGESNLNVGNLSKNDAVALLLKIIGQ